MLTLSVNGEELRRLESGRECEGPDAWLRRVEHYELKQASRFFGILRHVLTYHFGEILDKSSIKLAVRKKQEQFGEGVSDTVLQAA